MELEKQVCSLELAKRLDKLGVKQKSCFVWWYTEAMSTDVKYFPEIDWDKREWGLKPRAAYMKDSGRDVAAFTIAELGERFPPSVKFYTSIDEPGKWVCWVENRDIKQRGTMVDAAAKMLIYLIENKIIAA